MEEDLEKLIHLSVHLRLTFLQVILDVAYCCRYNVTIPQNICTEPLHLKQQKCIADFQNQESWCVSQRFQSNVLEMDQIPDSYEDWY